MSEPLSVDDVRESIALIEQQVSALTQIGFEFYGVEDTLYVVAPAGVEAMAGRCFTETARDKSVQRHVEEVCSITDSGGW